MLKQDVQQVKENLELLRDTSGKKAKIEVLEKITNHVSTDETIIFLLNDYITTGLKSAKLNKEIKKSSGKFVGMNSIISLLKTVTKNNTGKNSIVDLIQMEAKEAGLDKDEKEFLYAVLSKTFKFGMSADSYNASKAGELYQIPTFGVQLAQTYDEKTHAWLEKEIEKGHSFVLTNKYNGNRCITFVENGTVKHYSRSGKEITGLELLESDFLRLPSGYVYESELTKDLESVTDLDEAFREVNGEINSKNKNKDVHSQVFDVIDIEDFKKGVSSLNYFARRQDLNVFVPNNLERVHLAPILYHGKDITMIKKQLLEQNAKGEEGVMIQLAEGFYHNKRTRDLLKAKTFFSADLRVVGFSEGQNRLKGTLGALVVNYKGNELGVIGMDDKTRRDIWENQDKYLGKIAEVSYQGESKSKKTGALSLQFATFVDFRWDKDEESYEI